MPIVPPPPPASVGQHAAEINPFDVKDAIVPIQDEYAVLPPVLANTAKRMDRIADKLEDKLDDMLESGKIKEATQLVLGISRTQREKSNSVAVAVRAADSTVGMIQAQTQAALVEKLPRDANGLPPELRKGLLDLIARREFPKELDVTNDTSSES